MKESEVTDKKRGDGKGAKLIKNEGDRMKYCNRTEEGVVIGIGTTM